MTTLNKFREKSDIKLQCHGAISEKWVQNGL